jgi:hypothetical protein
MTSPGPPRHPHRPGNLAYRQKWLFGSKPQTVPESLVSGRLRRRCERPGQDVPKFIPERDSGR